MRILLTRLSSLGDVVHTWPLVDALAQLTPQPHLTWLVEEQYQPLVAPHPAVDRTLPVATRRWRRQAWRPVTYRQVWGALKVLRDLAPDLALDPQGLMKSAIWGAVAGARRRLGLAGEVRREWAAGVFYTTTAPSPLPHRHAVDVALSLLAALGVTPPWGAAPDGSFLAPLPSATHADPGPVVIFPGAGRAGKRWGAPHFAAVARQIATKGWEVVILWGPDDRQLAADIARAADVPLAPPTPLYELPQYLVRARGVVGGDTGPVHLAAALGVPTVMLHLDTDPRRSGARGRKVVVLDGRPGTGALLAPDTVGRVAVRTFTAR